MTSTLHRFRNALLAPCALASLLAAAAAPATTTTPAPPPAIRVNVDAQAKGAPFPHFWERMFGSGRAALALRASYRRDMRMVKQATGFAYVRAHGILDEDVGVFTLDKQDRPIYNFSYVDQIYDGLLALGVKPYIELSFMPPDLDSHPDAAKPFFYKLRASPPKSYALWDGLIEAFARHLVARYGIDEVSSWYFEAWNEPDIAFWNGTPAQASYFKLYDHTARDLKAVSPRLRVGGPATSAVAWIPDFLKHAHEQHVPVDFVSTHAYGDVCPDVRKVHRQIAASPYPHLPFILSEFNAAAFNRPDITDATYMGPYLAKVIHDCDGHVDVMSFWAFSDVFEEQGVVKTPFYGGFGLVAERGIPKPSFNAFTMLHRLGDTRLPAGDGPVLATRRGDGSLVLALWNYAPPVSSGTTYVPGPPKGEAKRFEVIIDHPGGIGEATVWRLDTRHGNVIPAFDAMGRPDYPSLEQIRTLREAARMAAPEHVAVHDGRFNVEIPPQGLVVVQLR
ncbi:glycosyl hydrolase [Fulvimonas sp. R45]|uniref:GH39 family glycosyl hydrolase n=1 Tax=Fulvimonas sp. R45 TaxID=3045937 RepID=UPI00265E5180|nr:glycosyl hydrolase [Fulvimonas sp. R45]MDO1527702.1 glycosyl hydrolase [Fulvimonas sp. R45]